MPVEYKVPGVYIEELQPSSRPIAGVATAMPVFIGFTRTRPAGNTGQPVFVASWNQYVEKFCTIKVVRLKDGKREYDNQGNLIEDDVVEAFLPGFYLSHAVYGYFLNGGESCYVQSLKVWEDTNTLYETGKGTLSIRSITGETAFEIETNPDANKNLRNLKVTIDSAKPEQSTAAGQQPGTTASADNTSTIPPPEEPSKGEKGKKSAANQPPANATSDAKNTAVTRVDPELFNLTVECDGVTEAYPNLTIGTVANALNDSKLIKLPAAPKGDAQRPRNATYAHPRYTFTARIIPKAADFKGEVSKRTGISALEEVTDATMIICPDLMSAYMRTSQGTEDRELLAGFQKELLAHCANMKDRFAILDAPPDLDPEGIRTYRNETANFDGGSGKYGALYYPWISIANPAPSNGQDRIIMVPPSGHIAGIYARVDAERGVHKAPANEAVRGALKLERRLIDSEQGILNPLGINCIREFPGRGILVWGARTLAEESSEWRYINVRRLFNFVEESIYENTQWVVFEPNDMDTWERVKRTITEFLTRVWRSGALFGATPEQAFYVKCDAELNPPAVRDAGQLIVEVGIAPVKPAEFVIFRFKQLPGGGGVEE